MLTRSELLPLRIKPNYMYMHVISHIIDKSKLQKPTASSKNFMKWAAQGIYCSAIPQCVSNLTINIIVNKLLLD